MQLWYKLLFSLVVDLGMESIKEDSKLLDYVSKKLETKKVTKQEITKQS